MRQMILGFYAPQRDKRREQDRDRYIGWFLTTFTIVLLVSLGAAALLALSVVPFGYRAFEPPNFLSFIGISLLVGAAGFAVGGFIGFLFGVPRIRTSEMETEPERGRSRGAQVVSNTNLEQLSDWLTKILVGVGLVQIHELNTLLVNFREQIDTALTASDGHRLAGAGFSACLILIGSTVAGFLAAYLKSKTDLMDAFREPLAIVQSALGEVAQKLIADAARDVLDRPTSTPDACSRDTAAKLVQFVPPGSDDPELYQLVGMAHAVLKNFKPAAEALKTAVDLRRERGLEPDLTLNALATRALALAGQVDVARDVSAAGLHAGTYDNAAVENALAAMFAQLYARDGSDNAINIGERLAQDAEACKSGRLWLYLACAYGQRHAALLAQRESLGEGVATAEVRMELDTTLAATRDNALEATRTALRLDRERNEDVLRQQWDPHASKEAGETDLESLHDDPAFAALFAG